MTILEYRKPLQSFFMNNVQTQNGKVHEGMLPVFNSDAVEITLTGLCNF